MKINVYGGQMEPTVKSPFLSKTLWGNLLMALAAFFAGKYPEVKKYMTPENVAYLFMVVNFVLRFVTKDKLQLS